MESWFVHILYQGTIFFKTLIFLRSCMNADILNTTGTKNNRGWLRPLSIKCWCLFIKSPILLFLYSLSLRDSWPLTRSIISPDCTSEHQTCTTQMRLPGPQATDIKDTVIISPQTFSFLNFLCLGNYVCMCTQSCPTFCDATDCSLPGPSAHGIFQARIWANIR